MSMWTYEKRQAVNKLVKEGYVVKQISRITGISVQSLTKELKRGLTEEEYIDKRYVKYNMHKAITTEIIETIGNKQWQMVKGGK